MRDQYSVVLRKMTDAMLSVINADQDQENTSWEMVNAKNAQTTTESQITIENAHQYHVPVTNILLSMDTVPNALHLPELTPPEENAALLNVNQTRSCCQRVFVRLAQITKELMTGEELASKAHAVTQSTMMTWDTAWTAHNAPDQLNQDSPASPIHATQAKFSPTPVTAKHAHHIRDQHPSQLLKANVVESAILSNAHLTQSSLPTVPANHAMSGPSQCPTRESVDQRSAEPERSCWEPETAKSAQTTAEEMENQPSNSYNTPNACQINAQRTKSCRFPVPALIVAHTRRPMTTRETVLFQLAVTEQENSSKTPPSSPAQSTPELLKTARPVFQMIAHWDKDSCPMDDALTAMTTWEPPQTVRTAEDTPVRGTKYCSLTEHAKTALHSRRLQLAAFSVSQDNALRLRDFSQAVSVRTARPTQELSTTERPVLQTSVPPDKRSSKTELARTAQSSPEPSPTEENVPARSVPPGRSSRLMVDALTAIHTPELHQMERFASHTTATTDRSLDQMEPVSTAQTTRELKEPVSPVDPILVTSDREYCRMVLASTAHSINQSAPTEDAAAHQLASHRLSTSQRMVSAKSAPSTRWPDQMAPPAWPTPPRSLQIHKSSPLPQSHLRAPKSLPAAPPLAATSGLMNNSCPRIRLPASTWTRAPETWASFWAALWDSQQPPRPSSLLYSLHWMLSEKQRLKFK